MYQVLLDAPDTPTKRVQIARLGPLSDSRYGDFAIDETNVRNWQKNLSALPGGRALIDQDHKSERKPRDSRASGWITGIHLDGDRVMADVEWTPRGVKALRSKTYQFLSPAFGPHTDEHGKVYEDTLCSVALTNKPALTSMPCVTLAAPERLEAAESALKLLDVSQAERDRAHAAGNSLPDKSYPINNTAQLHSAAVLAASKHGDYKAARKLIKRRAKELGVDVTTLPGFGGKSAGDDDDAGSRSMDAKAATIRMLDLAVDADDAAVVKAVRKLQKKASKPSRKLLEQHAARTGLVLMDAKRVKKLERDAAARQVAERHIHEQRFEHAFELALNDPRGARVTPAEKERLHNFYTLDAEGTLALIDERQPIVNAKPIGSATVEVDATADADPAQLAAAGIHPTSHQLDRKLKAKLRELGRPMSDYPVLLEQVHRGEVVL